MKTALIQMNTYPEKKRNLENAGLRIKEAAGQGADISVLPEMFCCEYRNRSFVANKEPKGGEAWQALSAAAAENNIWVIGGSVPEEEGGKLYNTCFVFNRKGEQVARHRKMHLFDIDVKGGQRFKESDTFTAGDDITVFDTEFGKIGVVICFDIRFPELARLEAMRGAKLIFCPAAFNMTTGPAHWELTFRARAVEDQAYFAACSPARMEGSSYIAFGHSLVASPWGEVLCDAGICETVLYCDIDFDYADDIRAQLPLLSARREDVYELRLKK